ncbi:CA [Mytilus coruscus]|uniref:CA n=1 Tax=Mytilus coruscus TaxID=42192 RepID=A0A6J8F077_MYTCO|nr:CA [Mytilus coruscus]
MSFCINILKKIWHCLRFVCVTQVSFSPSDDGPNRPVKRTNSSSWMINIVRTIRFKHDALKDHGFWYLMLATTIANNRKRIRNQVLKRPSSFVKVRKVGFVSDVTVGEFLEHFIYTKSSEWSTQFPDSNGTKQSPINLVSKTAIYDPKLREKLLSISYTSSRETDFLNNGQTVVIYPKSRNDTSVRQEQAVRSVITGGPLDDDEYELAEIRFHWGRCSGRGSEHTVNGKAFPMELQFIHWNSTLYQNLEEATGKENGIAAICLFVQIGRENPAFRALIADSYW